MTGGISDGKFSIGKNQGLSQAIAQEMGLTEEQTQKLGSVWFKIIEQAENAEVTSKNNEKRTWSSRNAKNLVVGDTFDLSKVWGNIVKLVNDKLGTNFKVEKEEHVPVELSEAEEKQVKHAPAQAKYISEELSEALGCKNDVAMQLGFRQQLDNINKDNITYLLTISPDILNQVLEKANDTAKTKLENVLKQVLGELEPELDTSNMTSEDMINEIKEMSDEKIANNEKDLQITESKRAEEQARIAEENRVKQTSDDLGNIKFVLPDVTPKNIKKGQETADNVIKRLRNIANYPAEETHLTYIMEDITKDSLPYLLEQNPNFVDDIFEKYGEQKASDYLKIVLANAGFPYSPDRILPKENIKLLLNQSIETTKAEHEQQIADANATRNQELQPTIDEANNFLAEVANRETKPEIKKEGNKETATLDDGRTITIFRNMMGKIMSVHLNTNPEQVKTSHGSTYDYAEAAYYDNRVVARGDDGKAKDYKAKELGEDYNFENIKALAEKIFGE